MAFELKDGKLTFKPDGGKDAEAAGNRSFTMKIDGNRLSKLQGILTHSGWKNPAKATATETTKWFNEQAALKAVAFNLLDFIIGEHSHERAPEHTAQSK